MASPYFLIGWILFTYMLCAKCSGEKHINHSGGIRDELLYNYYVVCCCVYLVLCCCCVVHRFRVLLFGAAVFVDWRSVLCV